MKRLFAIALLFAGLAAQAQETPTVTARVEPDSIMIGDRFDYVIDVEKDLVQVVEFPVFDPRDGTEAAFYVFSLLQHLSSVLSCFH